MSRRNVLVFAVALIASATGPPVLAETSTEKQFMVDNNSPAVPVPAQQHELVLLVDIAASLTLTMGVDTTHTSIAIAAGNSLPPPNKDSPPSPTQDDFLYIESSAARLATAHLALRPGSYNASQEWRPTRFLNEDAAA